MSKVIKAHLIKRRSYTWIHINLNYTFFTYIRSYIDLTGSKCWIWMTSPMAPLSMSTWKMKVILYLPGLAVVPDISLWDTHSKSDSEESEMCLLLFFWWRGHIGEHGTLLVLHQFECKSQQSLCNPLESPGHRNKKLKVRKELFIFIGLNKSLGKPFT